MSHCIILLQFFHYWSVFHERWQEVPAHNAFFLLRNCFAIPKLLHSQRTSPPFWYPGLLSEIGSKVLHSVSSFLNVKLDDAQKMRIFLPTELFPRDSSLLLPFYLRSMLLIQPAVLYLPNDALSTTAVHITSPFRVLRSRALLQLGRCMYSTDRNQGLFRFLCSKLMFSFLS